MSNILRPTIVRVMAAFVAITLILGCEISHQKPIDMHLSECRTWVISYLPTSEYDIRISIVTKDTEQGYAVTIVRDEEYCNSDIETIANNLLGELKADLDYHNTHNGNILAFYDILQRGSSEHQFNLSPGTYRAVVIAYTNRGTISDKYSVSNRFTITEGVSNSTYEAWLGKWNVVGNNNKIFEIELHDDIANRSFLMTGWEGFSMPIPVEYNSTQNTIAISAQCVAEEYDLGKDYGKVDIYFYGSDSEGYYYDTTQGNYYIAEGIPQADGSVILQSYTSENQEYPDFAYMSFMAMINGEMCCFSNPTNIPTFSATMLKVEHKTLSRE